MGQSLSKIYMHFVFHTKNNKYQIRKEDKESLFAYMGSILNENDSSPIKINGDKEHVHILCIMSKNITAAKLMEGVKRHSSRWIKTLHGTYRNFAWQNGYSGFSVSPSLVEKNIQYITNQEEHHKKMSYKEELIAFLKEYDIEYNEKYLFNDPE
jgi:putative transposase